MKTNTIDNSDGLFMIQFNILHALIDFGATPFTGFAFGFMVKEPRV